MADLKKNRNSQCVHKFLSILTKVDNLGLLTNTSVQNKLGAECGQKDL